MTYVDDETLDLQEMLADMRRTKGGSSSACPSPEEYACLMRQHEKCVVITLSAKLSGSYNSALVARDIVLEETPEKKIHIFDSESASSGQVQAALMVHELDKAGKSFEEIVEAVSDYLTTMRTLFVLEDLGNFIKNGRLGKVSGAVATVLSIRPIMGEDGHGEIVMVEKVRGTQNALNRLVGIVGEYTVKKAAKSVRLVLSHCNCEPRAIALKNQLLEQCSALSEVIIISTGGLSSMYANEGGVILAF